MPSRIYFDNAATTRLDPRVLAAMRPYLEQSWGNPSSLHREGRHAREAVETARRQVADLLGAEPGEIVFTSGGTEADHLALQARWRPSARADATSSPVPSNIRPFSLVAGCSKIAAPR